MAEKFSVLMSVYSGDSAQNFEQAFMSNLNQSLVPNEIVIVQDGAVGSDLNELLDKFEFTFPDVVRVLRLQKNGGLGAALREGLDVVSNELVARADADDVSDFNRFEMQVKTFARDAHLVVVGGMVKEFAGNIQNVSGMRVVPNEDSDIRKFAKYRSPFNHPAVMFKKSEVVKAGSYIPFHDLEDYHLWARLISSSKGTFKNINEAVVYMRSDEGLYSRRGGLKYFLSFVRLRIFFVRIGFLNVLQAGIATSITLVQVFLPSRVREYLYKKFLRVKVND